MPLYLDVFSPTIDGALIDAHNSAVVNKTGFNAVTQTYSLGKLQGFNGSPFDHLTHDPAFDTDSFNLAGFSNLGTMEVLHGAGVAPTFKLVGPVITFSVNHPDGTTDPSFGGIVLGENADGLFVQQINGFFDLGVTSDITHGEVFVGTPSTSYHLFMNTTNLTLKDGPVALPIVFGAVGVAEPSSALMFAAAAVALVAARRLRSIVRAA